MPTYKNNGAAGVSVLFFTGCPGNLDPGETEETLKFYNHDDLELISREPLFRSPLAVDRITADNSETSTTNYVDLDPVADYFLVDQVDGTITVWAESDAVANRVLLLLEQTEETAVGYQDCFGIYDRLVVTGSGSCRIAQHRVIPGAQ